jgi:hypothetical protein
VPQEELVAGRGQDFDVRDKAEYLLSHFLCLAGVAVVVRGLKQGDSRITILRECVPEASSRDRGGNSTALVASPARVNRERKDRQGGRMREKRIME